MFKKLRIEHFIRQLEDCYDIDEEEKAIIRENYDRITEDMRYGQTDFDLLLHPESNRGIRIRPWD